MGELTHRFDLCTSQPNQGSNIIGSRDPCPVQRPADNQSTSVSLATRCRCPGREAWELMMSSDTLGETRTALQRHVSYVWPGYLASMGRLDAWETPQCACLGNSAVRVRVPGKVGVPGKHAWDWVACSHLFR